MTGMEEMQKQAKQERDIKQFELMIESFLRRYKPPQDSSEAIEFERDLHLLVRQIYRDAQEPLVNYITQLVSAVPK